MDVLTKDVRDISLIDLLYADNLAVRGESLDEVIGKLERWKRVLEGKGLRVNVEKTKEMQLINGKKAYVPKVNLCVVCGEQVRHNSNWCKK